MANPEDRNIRRADPAQLMKDNPAALIVNKESYARMAGYFSPEKFDPPQISRVITFSSEHGEVIKDYVIDGMTRMKFVNDNQSNPEVIPPSFIFRVRDVTESELNNPMTVPEDERVEGQKALTLLQYLRAVAPPTIEHSEIAADRIAAHLINGWEKMVGEEISRRFPAIAAISLLESANVPTATKEMLRKYLHREKELITGETIEQRNKLISKLLEMASIINQTRSHRGEIGRAAFLLIGSESEVIGGEKEAKKQIFDLLRTREVDLKLIQADPGGAKMEQMRHDIGGVMIDAFRRFSKSPNKEQAFRVLGEALRDPNLHFKHVLDVLTSPSPVERYTEVRKEINRDRLANAYTKSQKRGDLTETEALLIDQLGSRTFLEGSELSALVQGVISAESEMQRAARLKADLAEQRDELLKNGVSAQTIDNVTAALEKTQEDILSSRTLQALTMRTRGLQEAVGKAARSVSFEYNSYRVSTVVGSAFPEGLGQEFSSKLERVSQYIFREFGIYHQNKQLSGDQMRQIRIRLQQLKGLDQDLQSAVLKEDGCRIEYAIKRQKERRITMITSPTPTPVVRDETKVPQNEIRPSQRTEPITPQTSRADTMREASPIIDKGEVERRRVATNNERLGRAIRYVLGELRQIDLDNDEYSTESFKLGEQLIIELGNRFLRHPDIVRLVRESQAEQAKRIKILETRVTQEIEDAQKDTRTGI